MFVDECYVFEQWLSIDLVNISIIIDFDFTPFLLYDTEFLAGKIPDAEVCFPCSRSIFGDCLCVFLLIRKLNHFAYNVDYSLAFEAKIGFISHHAIFFREPNFTGNACDQIYERVKRNADEIISDIWMLDYDQIIVSPRSSPEI